MSGSHVNALSGNVDRKKRLAIVGGGSSGLVSLKFACEFLPDWHVECFEKSDSITGVWGHPYDEFVSTSTKYTTQFSCYPEFDALVNDDGGDSRREFFRDGEYGEYLERFARHFSLEENVAKQCNVERIRKADDEAGWVLSVRPLGSTDVIDQRFDAVILCTGLVAAAKDVGDDDRMMDVRGLLRNGSSEVPRNKTVVVVGGGESAVDFADRLSARELNNRVYLSLRSGVRVSPRYHPIRGVPSDFLRNRLMLSIDPAIRNWIGGFFVAARIRYEALFLKLFPGGRTKPLADASSDETRRYWSEQLRRTSKDDVFNMFHNKSDGFLDAVAEGRLQIVGPPKDDAFAIFQRFDSDGEIAVEADVIVPAVGFRSTLAELSDGLVSVRDFHLGCVHVAQPSLYLVGFARPIIGNIPSISEMQARYVCGLLAEKWSVPSDVLLIHEAESRRRSERFRKLNLEHVYPVEMIPYCDRLAGEMDAMPTRSSSRWWSLQTAPATTLDYRCFDRDGVERPETRTYLPFVLIALLFFLKPFDWAYRLLRWR